jgi:hypothetical protein
VYLGQIEDDLKIRPQRILRPPRTVQPGEIPQSFGVYEVELGTHTKINKFWTLSFQASHWTLSFAKRGSSKVSQGSSSPLGHRLRVLGIDMGHYMTIVRASGIE